MTLPLLFKTAGAAIHYGSVTLPLDVSFSTLAPVRGSASLDLNMSFSTTWSHAPTTNAYPDPVYEVAFDSPPLTASPAWETLTTRVRALNATRGRSYEFDRMETGTMTAALANRDAALSPANSASTYAPLKATRPVRALLAWDTVYPLFRGITEGYPQAYPNTGTDALVGLQANDLFYALNRARFNPGETQLTTAIVIVPPDPHHPAGGPIGTIDVVSTALPMPQAVPFDITLDEGGIAEETMSVTEILGPTSYAVTRTGTPQEHGIGAVVTTQAVSFGEALSGTRIQQVLERVGFDATWYDLDAGQSVMVASEDLASISPLEHINLIVEAEFGRFFASREGRFTFRDRHAIILDFLDPVVTFADWTLVTTDEIPYRIEGALEHSEEKLYNRVKITHPGGVVDISDQASIDEHFERAFEREWPYANVNDAVSAAYFVLARQSEHTLRLPQVVVHPVNDPATLWPLVLDREIGDRCRFRYQPVGGGDEIDQDVIIEGIAHDIRPKHHAVSFQLTEADPNAYWILGLAGYSELGVTTVVGF